MFNHFKKRGQVTIFIILGIVLLVAIVAYFVISSDASSSSSNIPSSLEPAYQNFISCLEEDTLTGASVLGSHGGYIDLPEFEAGSRHYPFSSQLNFLGNPIPYWYYVSGNGFEKEQIPSRSEMENQLETFIEERVRNCNFESYHEQSYVIEMRDPNANVKINDESIELDLEMRMGMERGQDSVFVESHYVEVFSNIGQLHDSAVDIYEMEQETLFLEERAVDILRSYAPVDGFEISCSPLVWSAENVATNLTEAIEVNTLALNANPDQYYDLDLPIEHEVRFLNSRNWSSTYEISPNEGDFLVSNPVGNQQGLGILGFCYVPYHYVYNMRYPILIQIYDENNPEEIFQFPVAILIEGNLPRTPTSVEAVTGPELQLCEYKNTLVRIGVLNNNLESVDARVSYECLGQTCSIGQTENGILEENFPQCVNGRVIVNAEDYEQGEFLFTSVNGGSLEVVLDKIYPKQLNLRLNNLTFDEEAIVTFTSKERVESVLYPEESVAELSEGAYNVSVNIYGENKVNFGATTKEQCIDVSRGGLLGVFGFTEERCFDIEVPEQDISNVLIGGGKSEIYFSENNLASNNILELNVPRFETPETLGEVQVNYLLFENSDVEASFK